MQQMQDFFGLKSASMTMEYISTSKSAVQSMASSLCPPEHGLSAKVEKMEIAGISAEIKEEQEASVSSAESVVPQTDGLSSEIVEPQNVGMPAEFVEPETAGMSAAIKEPHDSRKTLVIKPAGDILDRIIKNNQKVIFVYGDFSGTVN